MVCTILMPPSMPRFFFSTRTRWRPRRNTSPPRKPVRFFPKKKSCSMRPSRKQLQLRPAPRSPHHHHLHQRRRPDKLVATALWAVRNFATVGDFWNGPQGRGYKQASARPAWLFPRGGRRVPASPHRARRSLFEVSSCRARPKLPALSQPPAESFPFPAHRWHHPFARKLPPLRQAFHSLSISLPSRRARSSRRTPYLVPATYLPRP